MESQIAAIFSGPRSIGTIDERILCLFVSTDITQVVRTIIMVRLTTHQDLSTSGYTALFPMSHGIILPLIAVLCRNVTVLLVTTHGTCSFLAAGNSTSGTPYNAPLSIGMSFSSYGMITGAHITISPVSFFVILIAYIGMDMFFTIMLFFPVIFPVTAADAGTVFTAGGCTVRHTAVYAQSTVLTDLAAIRAHLTTLRADLGTILADATGLTQGTTFAAVFFTIATDLGTIFTDSTTRARSHTVSTMRFTTTADGCAIFAETTIFTQNAALGAMLATIFADDGAIGTEATIQAQIGTVAASLTTVYANGHAIVTHSAILTQYCTF